MLVFRKVLRMYLMDFPLPFSHNHLSRSDHSLSDQFSEEGGRSICYPSCKRKVKITKYLGMHSNVQT